MRSIRSCNVRRRRAIERRLDAAYFASLPRAVLVPNGFEPRSAEMGDTVKIGFMAEGVGMTEWMWGDIVSKDGSNYVVRMCNTAVHSAMRAGTLVEITDENILITWERCPLRASRDLEVLGGAPFQRIDMLRAVETETGLDRRSAVERILATVNGIAGGAAFDPADPVVAMLAAAATNDNEGMERCDWAAILRERLAA